MDNFLKELIDFNKRLDTPPPASEIKERGGFKYLPISFQENKLREIFGFYQTRNIQTQIVVNEIVGSIELGVFHPILKEWIWNVGCGAVMITMKSGSDVLDVSSKIKNCMETAYPHLLSDCIKNASLKLGKAFGADLNREHTDNFSVLEAMSIANCSLEDAILIATNEISLMSNVDAIRLHFTRQPNEYKKIDSFLQVYKDRIAQLETKKLS